MCFLGLPALLIVLADNQRPAARELSASGVAVEAGDGLEVTTNRLAGQLTELIASPDRRRAMSERGRAMVDGHGAERVAQELRHGIIRLRRATTTDCRLLYELAIDPVVRASSFSPGPISWEQHVAWFQSKMETGNCYILIGEDSENVIGQVRIDVRPNGDGEIDVIVAPEFRGQGRGGRLIDLGVQEFFTSPSFSRVHAYILPDNRASQQAFEKAGFRNLGEEQVKGHRALHYVRERVGSDAE